MTATFTRMDQSTAEEWAAIGAETSRNQGRVADRILMLKPTREGNTILLAWRGGDRPGREELERRAVAIEAKFDLPARKWLKLLQNLPERLPTAA